MQAKEKAVSESQSEFEELLGVKTNPTNFKRFLDAGLLKDVDETFITEVQNYWEDNYDKTIDPILNLAFINLTGKKDTRLMPGVLVKKEILPLFNDYNMSSLYPAFPEFITMEVQPPRLDRFPPVSL